jgi:hypothetical protein
MRERVKSRKSAVRRTRDSQARRLPLQGLNEGGGLDVEGDEVAELDPIELLLGEVAAAGVDSTMSFTK